MIWSFVSLKLKVSKLISKTVICHSKSKILRVENGPDEDGVLASDFLDEKFHSMNKNMLNQTIRCIHDVCAVQHHWYINNVENKRWEEVIFAWNAQKRRIINDNTGLVIFVSYFHYLDETVAIIWLPHYFCSESVKVGYKMTFCRNTCKWRKCQLVGKFVIFSISNVLSELDYYRLNALSKNCSKGVTYLILCLTFNNTNSEFWLLYYAI